MRTSVEKQDQTTRWDLVPLGPTKTHQEVKNWWKPPTMIKYMVEPVQTGSFDMF